MNKNFKQTLYIHHNLEKTVGFVIRVDIKQGQPVCLSHVTVEDWCLCVVGGCRTVCLYCSGPRISIRQQCQLPYIVPIFLERDQCFPGAANHLHK